MLLPQTLRVAAYTLIVQDERLLLCRLSSVERESGSWTLPGGGMDFGEHPEETAVREAREETGLAVRVTGLVTVDSRVCHFADLKMHWLRFIYRAEIVGGSLADEIDGSTDSCRWFTREQAEALPLVELGKLGVPLAFN